MAVTPQMLEGARYCVNDWARVRKGEDVLILRDLGDFTEDAVVEAFLQVTEEAGAKPVVMSCPIFNSRVEEPPPSVIKALHGTDVVFFFSPYPALLHCKAGKQAMVEYGVRNVPVLTNTAELLGSEWARFPVELQLKLHEMSNEAIARSPRVRVRGSNGTDITGVAPIVQRVNRSLVVHGLGWHGIWPGDCGPCLTPMREMNGVVVVDVLPGFPGFLKDKVKVTVKDNRIVSIEGGKEADWFRDLIENSVKSGSDADVLHELQWGINPKGDIELAAEMTGEDEVVISRMARTVHFGFGSGQYGFHWDTVVVDGFDIILEDGSELYRDGYLTHLDDPEVRKIASKYGDPDEVLKEYSSLRQAG